MKIFRAIFLIGGQLAALALAYAEAPAPPASDLDPSHGQNRLLTKQLKTEKPLFVWTHKSQLWMAMTGPKYKHQEYMFKQATAFKWQFHTLESKFEYKAGYGTEDKEYETDVLGLKYIYNLSKHWGPMAGYTIKYEPFQPLPVRENYDIGVRYYQLLAKKTYWIFEPTLRLIREKDQKGTRSDNLAGHAYTQIGHELANLATITVDAEYTRYFRAPNYFDLYLEPGIEVNLTKHFWLRFSHMMTYTSRNLEKGEPAFYYYSTTSIVANY